MKHTPQIPAAVRESDNILVLSNDYFEARHDGNAGGCPVSLIFKNGTGENFLMEPVSSHIALKKNGEIVFFRQSLGKADTFSCTVTDDGPDVFAEGLFSDENGNTIPVRYRQTFSYRAWGRVDVRLEIRIEKTIEQVYEIGTCGFHVPERINVLGVRPGCPQPPPDGYLLEAESNLRWFDLERKRSYTQQYCASCRLIPSYFSLFEKGVEGLEFWREDCGSSWDRPFGIGPGSGIFVDDSKRHDPGRKHIRVEPFNSWSYPRTFQPGTETFRYTLGLPFVKRKADAGKAIFHIAVTSRTWPDRNDMEKLAGAGVKLIRLHDDDSFLHPSWRDCYYPPYDEENMKKMDRVIDLAHEFGIKIVPYFSLKEFHPDCPEYPEKARQWNRWVHSDGRIIAEEGPYGGYMCMKSGWLSFLKSCVERVLEHHKFDGVYYDHLWFRYCRHPEHAGGLWHTDSEEILDFLFWTREYLGENGIIFLHTSACPTIIGENLSDLIFIGEDMPYARPLPDTFPPDMDFVSVAPRNWVPAGAHWTSEFRESMMISCLKHCPGGPFGISGFMLEMASIFKTFRLNDMNFRFRLACPGEGAGENVYVNVYSDENRIVLFCANLSKSVRTISLNLPVSSLADGGRVTKTGRLHGVKTIASSSCFSRLELECPAENAGAVELEIQR